MPASVNARLVGAALGVGLDRGAGLARDDDDGAVEPVGQGRAHVVGVGGVEDRQLHARPSRR